MGKDPELANTVIDFYNCVPHRQSREKPLVVVPAVTFIYNTAVIGLQDAELLEGRAARHNMCFVAFGQLHGNAKRNQTKFPPVMPMVK